MTRNPLEVSPVSLSASFLRMGCVVMPTHDFGIFLTGGSSLSCCTFRSVM